jgi:hypothetical protein
VKEAKHLHAPDSLQSIPGVGPNLARDLSDIGYRYVSDLRDADPEKMYQRLSSLRGRSIDRCVLYVFRCAVYYAAAHEPDPERLKWWHWKDSPAAAAAPSASAPGKSPARSRRKS